MMIDIPNSQGNESYVSKDLLDRADKLQRGIGLLPIGIKILKIAQFAQAEIERVRIERDNLKVSIKSIQDGHTLAVELLAEALGKLKKAEKEENKATFRIFKSLAEALGHDVNLMRDEEIMEIDPYGEIRDLKTELEEVKKFAKYADTEWKELEKHLKAELEEEKKYSDELKEDRDNYRGLCVIHLDALEEERKHADWLEEALSRIHGTESDHRGIDKSKCFLCISLAAHKERRK